MICTPEGAGRRYTPQWIHVKTSLVGPLNHKHIIIFPGKHPPRNTETCRAFFSLFLSSWFLRFYFCCVTYFLVSACPYMPNNFFPWKRFIFVRFNSSAVERFSTKSHLQQNKAKFSNVRRSFEFLCFHFRFTFVAMLDHSTDAWVSVWVKQKMEHSPALYDMKSRQNSSPFADSKAKVTSTGIPK